MIATAAAAVIQRATPSCWLCAGDRTRPSWLGSTIYAGKVFTYLECVDCGSLFCDPMPDAETLGLMYGASYGTTGDDAAVEDPKQPRRVVDWLERKTPGSFIDYGCGGGHLLVEARRLGWTAAGVEFDPGVASTVEQRIGIRVFNRNSQAELPRGGADVVHLGDVLEHLTDVETELRDVLRLVKPGGHLIAQGPLEANTTLFTAVLRGWRRARQPAAAGMAPYHVTLATATGQRALFARVGLHTVEFSMHEVDWPAPSVLGWADARHLRRVGMFALRRLSRLVTAVSGGRFGNRYFYVGRRPPSPPEHQAGLRRPR